MWKTRADALNQAMVYIMNSNNEIAKKDLRLTYSQENYTTYQADIKAVARYLSTQYPNNKSVNQRKTNKEKGMIQNLKIRTTPRLVPLGYMLRIIQQMKTLLLLMKELVRRSRLRNKSSNILSTAYGRRNIGSTPYR